MSKNFIKFLVLFFIPVLFLTIAEGINHTQAYSFHEYKTYNPDSIKVITDSNCSLHEALSGKYIPARIREMLTVVTVYYYSFDGKLHKGQIVINKNLAGDIRNIFQKIKDRKFPVEKVIPIYKYNWNDKSSMEDNNTSAFNYRVVKGSNRLSKHATGKAIDINPKLNPQIIKGIFLPRGSFYNINRPGTISDTSFIVKAFTGKGWSWGGNWKHLKDYQHFEK